MDSLTSIKDLGLSFDARSTSHAFLLCDAQGSSTAAVFPFLQLFSLRLPSILPRVMFIEMMLVTCAASLKLARGGPFFFLESDNCF